MYIALTIIALVVGFVIGYLLVNGQKSRVEARAELLAQQIADQKMAFEALVADQKQNYEVRIAMLKGSHESQMADLRYSHDSQMAELKESYEKQLLQTKHDYKEQIDAQKEQMQNGLRFISEQLKSSSEEVLKRRSVELSEVNKEQLSQILTPLQTGLKQMQEEVEKNRAERAKTMTALDTAIRETIAHTKEIGERADNLANALTRDNKYQGNFGELCLSKMLQDMGFEPGKHYEEQVTLRDEAGNAILGEDSDKRMQPDVILHFPDNRDIIIDSKVSMTAFERYASAQTDEEKQQALKEHVASVRNQVKLLTQKSYWKQYNKKGLKLDFVVMFMFSESALQLALSEDPRLWHDAYDQGVLITGGQNLYALLRIMEISWKQMDQMENQAKIMQCADEIVARVQLFYKRFLEVEKKLDDAKDSFAALKTVTAPRGRSIITSATQLLKYGAKEDPKKNISLPKDADIQAIEPEMPEVE